MNVGRFQPINFGTYGDSKPLRILVAVCSCHRHAERRAACRATWLRRLPDNVAALFFVGEGAEAECPDVLVVPAEDDYASLSLKVGAMFRYAVEQLPFDWLFKCDDDTYLAPCRLRELVRHGSDMVGFVWNNAYRSVSGGAGYLMSRRLVEDLATVVPRRGPFEDVEFSRAARRLGFGITHDPRLQVGRGEPPAPENGRITSHWCSPAMQYEIDAAWGGVASD